MSFKCPYDGCSSSLGTHSSLFNHIRGQHCNGPRLPTAKLHELNAAYCPHCGIFGSTKTPKAHKCVGGQNRNMKSGHCVLPATHPTRQHAPAQPAQPQPAQPAQPHPHQPPHHFTEAPAAAHYTARPRPSSRVPEAVHKEFGDATAGLLRDFNDASDASNIDGARVALGRFLDFPGKVLSLKGGEGTARRARTCITLFMDGEEPRLAEPTPSQQRRMHRNQDRRLAGSVHRSLCEGNLRKAAAKVDAPPIARYSPEVHEELRHLHPTEALPPDTQPAEPAPPLQIDEATLRALLDKLPKGSGPGLSGWTYEHIRAAGTASTAAFTEIHRFVNAVLAGRLPHLPRLLDCRLLPQ